MQKHKEEKKELQANFSKTLLQSKLEIKEQTLQQLAHEIHDNLGQVASLIKIHLNTLRLDDQPKAEQKIEETKDLIKQLIADLKELSVSLNGERIIQLGIANGIETEVNKLRKIGAFTINFIQQGSVKKIDPNTTVILYRMVQEILNNIVKHSKAKEVDITMTFTKKILTLVISDNGIGFDVHNKINNGGSGLINLKNRAKLIRATFDIDTQLQKGTKISIKIPI
ncbi:sensor histidine kinase [Aquimarina sp. 2201CG1-2-11]|uniref:sensor histidine kinase n=1 Tax=Aquimarina discodermiae TaxID=3231043 RepID=UPI0034623BCF